MDDLTEFQRAAADFERGRHARRAVVLLTATHFDADILYVLSGDMGRRLSPLEDRELRRLHMASWASMGPRLAHLTRLRCLDLLGLPPGMLDDLAAQRKPVKRPWFKFMDGL